MPKGRDLGPRNLGPDAGEGDWKGDRNARQAIRQGLEHAGLPTRRHRLIRFRYFAGQLLEAMGKAGLAEQFGFLPPDDEE